MGKTIVGVGKKIRGGSGDGGCLFYVSYCPWRVIDSRISSRLLCGVKLKHRHERSTCFPLRRSSAHGFPPLAGLFKDSDLPAFNRSTLKRAYVRG